MNARGTYPRHGVRSSVYGRRMPTLPEIEEQLRDRLEAFPRPVCVEMLPALRLRN
jgi:hypothetical protein